MSDTACARSGRRELRRQEQEGDFVSHLKPLRPEVAA